MQEQSKSTQLRKEARLLIFGFFVSFHQEKEKVIYLGRLFILQCLLFIPPYNLFYLHPNSSFIPSALIIKSSASSTVIYLLLLKTHYLSYKRLKLCTYRLIVLFISKLYSGGIKSAGDASMPKLKRTFIPSDLQATLKGLMTCPEAPHLVPITSFLSPFSEIT